MERTINRIKVDDDKVRVRVTLSGEECEPGSRESEVRQHQLLQAIVDTPFLTRCGWVAFQKLQVRHDGRRWIAEAEALLKTKDDNDGKQA